MKSLPAGARDSWARIARRIRVPLGFMMAGIYAWLARPSKGSLLAGTLVLVPGLLLRGLASGHVRKNEELTTSGPYAYTRNPLYLGSLVLATGFAIAARSGWIVLALLGMFAGVYLPVIAGEERHLRREFPGYDEYARHVPRLWPRWTPYVGQPGDYSAARYWKHREYRAGIGCLLVLALLIGKLVW